MSKPTVKQPQELKIIEKIFLSDHTREKDGLDEKNAINEQVLTHVKQKIPEKSPQPSLHFPNPPNKYFRLLTKFPRHCYFHKTKKVRNIFIIAGFVIRFYDIGRNEIVMEYNLGKELDCRSKVNTSYSFKIRCYDTKERNVKIISIFLYQGEWFEESRFKMFHVLYFRVDFRTMGIEMVKTFIQKRESLWSLQENCDYLMLLSYKSPKSCQVDVWEKKFEPLDNKYEIAHLKKFDVATSVTFHRDESIKSLLFDCCLFNRDLVFIFPEINEKKRVRVEMRDMTLESTEVKIFWIDLKKSDGSMNMGEVRGSINHVNLRTFPDRSNEFFMIDVNRGNGVFMVNPSQAIFYHFEEAHKKLVFVASDLVIHQGYGSFTVKNVREGKIAKKIVTNRRDYNYRVNTVLYQKQKIVLFSGKKETLDLHDYHGSGIERFLGLGDSHKEKTEEEDEDLRGLFARIFSLKSKDKLKEKKENEKKKIDFSNYVLTKFAEHSVILHEYGMFGAARCQVFVVDFLENWIKLVFEVHDEDYRNMKFTRSTGGWQIDVLDASSVLLDGKYVLKVNFYEEFYYFMLLVWEKIRCPVEIMKFVILKYINPNAIECNFAM